MEPTSSCCQHGLQPHCWLKSWEALYHTNKPYKPVTSLHYMELYIPVIHFLLQEDLKHVTKQYKWAGSKQQVLFWKRRSGSRWHMEEPASPTNQCQSLHVLVHITETSPSKQVVKHGKEWDCQHLLTITFFPKRVLGGCLFIFNLIFKSWKRIHPTKKNETKNQKQNNNRKKPTQETWNIFIKE